MQKRTIAALALSAVIIPAAAFAQGNGNGNGRANGQRDDDRTQMRFREMDTDNDGVITRDEWRGSAQSFREHDTNHDGVLSGDEVWVGVNRRDGSRREELLARFERADRNGDGRVARNGWTGSTEAFKRMDESGDGIVTRDEFLSVAGAVGASGTVEPRNTSRAYQAGYERGRTEGRQAGKEDKGVNGGHWDLEGQ